MSVCEVWSVYVYGVYVWGFAHTKKVILFYNNIIIIGSVSHINYPVLTDCIAYCECCSTTKHVYCILRLKFLYYMYTGLLH